MLSISLRPVALAAALLLLTAPENFPAAKKPLTKKQTKVETCSALYKKYYSKGDRHKAIATTGGRWVSAPKTACGVTEGYSTKKAAETKALSVCNTMKKRFKSFGKCKVIESR